MSSTIHVEIPEGLREVLDSKMSDQALLERWSSEALIIEAYREGMITRGKVGELLDLSFSEREEWLQAREVPYRYDESDLEQDRKTLDDLFGR